MKCCYIDIHIHTSENANEINNKYDVNELKRKIVNQAKNNEYLISLTDHNIINVYAYKKMYEMGMNFLVGVELHIRNYDNCPPYHCHFIFNFDKCLNDINEFESHLKKINEILDTLYPNKLPSDCDKIPKLGDLINAFEGYEYLILPHGGQSHKTFDKSIPREGVKFDNVMERSIYYNMFDGFTARSNNGLEETQSYFNKLGISEFVNLVTCSDNYDISNYPNSKSGNDDFVPTWMYSSANFSGLRLALSERMRLSYGNDPREEWQEQIISAKLDNEKIKIDVNFEPGLNVIIGNSSSGKTLLVDSLYDKIENNNNSTYKDFNVKDLNVNNPSGIVPHYFRQNYILELIKEDKDNGLENSLSENVFIKKIFPLDEVFRKKIEKSLEQLRDKLQTLINSANEIENIEAEIKGIQNFTRLFCLGESIINPLTFMKPTESEKKILDFDDEKIKNIMQKIDELAELRGKIAFCENYDSELNSIKSKINTAYEEIKFAKFINKIIHKHIEEEENLIKENSAKKSNIIQMKNTLLEDTKKLVNNYKSFDNAFSEIIQFECEVDTKKVESSGHKLFIKNDFKLSKEIVLNALNQCIKNKIPTNVDNISPSSLFRTNYLSRPKIKDNIDLFNKVYTSISNVNKVKYSIIHKNGKNFSALSPGMKASVILDIILGYDGDNAPLIIDQPEDNLATNYINYDLVNSIKLCKRNRQVIMVSHNATIPVLGDAQCIIVCSNDKSKINIKSYKMEDNYDSKNSILDIIAEITDGGKTSIKKRFKKYNMKSYREENNETNC